MKPEVRDLSLYVHIPFCKTKCAYCDFLSFAGCGYDKQRQYVKALCKELEAYKSVSKEYIIKTIFIGGGTPSYVDTSLLEQIMETINKVFTVSLNVEVTIEGNPDSLTKDKLIPYRRMGINRLSIGLQSTDGTLLKALGRIHNYDQFIAAYYSAREAGFCNINVDLMSGLPGESTKSYIRTLAKVASLEPEHISAYSLIVEEGTPLSENETLLKQLPNEEEDRLLYAKTKILLKNSGYNRYEISNYAKEKFECKHNLVYWSGGEYLGTGLGAASYLKVWGKEKQYEKIRFHGVENLEEYIGRFLVCEGMQEDSYTNMHHLYEEEEKQDWYFETGKALEKYKAYEESAQLEFIRDYYQDMQFLKRKDEMEEFMFLGLRKTAGVSKKEFKTCFGVGIESVYGKIIKKYKEQKLLLEEGDKLFLSDKGIDVSNAIMVEFML